MLLPFAILLSLTTTKAQTGFGPYFLPNGVDTDPMFVTFGEFNTTHFFINIYTRGDHWFAFGFASGSGCTPESTDCYMTGTDAIIFANFQLTGDPVTAQEYELGNHAIRRMQASQDLEVITNTGYDGGVYEATANIRRPYDPSLYGDRGSYTITYPLAGDFCFLWAQGTEWIYTDNTAAHVAGVSGRGFKCVPFGGTTAEPTPSPSYGPTPGPTTDPTPRPTKQPSVAGDSGAPSPDPTAEPSIAPSGLTGSPSIPPTPYPTPSPTVKAGDPTRAPTPGPTPLPTKEPTASPTLRPTFSPLESGVTRPPSPGPTSDPTTQFPTVAPTPAPTPEPSDLVAIDTDNTGTDNTWLEENLTWILIIAAVAVIVCFCCALGCFWYSQHRRTEKRREKRQNMLTAEKFKLEQGLNIDAENKSKANKEDAQRRAKRNRKKRRKRTNEYDSDGDGDGDYVAPTGGRANVEEEDDESEDIEAGVVSTGGGGKKRRKKRPAKKRSKYEAADVDDEDDEEEEEEEEEKPKRRARKKPVRRGGGGRKGRSKFAGGDDEDEEDEKPKRRRRARPKAKRKPVVKEPSVDSDDSDEDSY